MWGAGILFVAIIAGVLIGWLVGRPPEPGAPASAASITTTTTNTAPTPDHPLVGLPPELELIPRDPDTVPVNFRRPDVTATAWEKQLDEIILGKLDATNKVLMLADLLKTAPAFSKAEVAQYLATTVPDALYGVAREILTNTQYSEAVYRTLFNNLINRSDPVRLPILLEIALNEEHPQRSQAEEMLDYALSDENATNADQWRAAIEARLRAGNRGAPTR